MALLCICNISPPSQLPAHPPEAYLDSWSKTTLKPCPSSNKATSYSTAQKDLKTFWKWLLSLGLAVHLPTVHHAASRRLPHLPSAAAQQQWSSNTTAAWNVKGELKAEGCSPKLCREGQASFFSLQTGRRVRNLHQTLTSSLPHSTIKHPLSADGLLLLLSLKATMFPLFTFAF